MNLEETLEKLGLNEKEAKVYLALLELGQDTVQNIAQRASITRPTTYNILDALVKKGLTTQVDQDSEKLLAVVPEETVNDIISFDVNNQDLAYAFHKGAISQEDYDLVEDGQVKLKCYSFATFKHPTLYQVFNSHSLDIYHRGEIKVWAVVDEDNVLEN
jgi:predicted DNA-binding transcriptional regulator